LIFPLDIPKFHKFTISMKTSSCIGSFCRWFSFLVAICLAPVACADPVVLGTVGMKAIHVASPSSQFQLVSVPFMKPSVVTGRLDGVDAGQGRISDAQSSFGTLQNAAAYVLRIRSGNQAGAWFTVSPLGGDWSSSAGTALVTNDNVAGDLASLAGNESFSIHPLFTFAELFPENGSVIPAGRVDVLASQIHLLESSVYSKYWLSDGSITDRPGWFTAGPNGLRSAGSDVILPGVSFFVVVPAAVSQSIVVRVFGEVLDDAIRIPVEPGFNLVSAPYNVSQVNGAGLPSFELVDFGFEDSSFAPGSSAGSGDQVLVFNQANGRFDGGFWLDQSGSPRVWRRISDGTPAGSTELEPGNGFVLLNRGSRYGWQQGH
jgi:uncharacterized protein (TIGR02597 family)